MTSFRLRHNVLTATIGSAWIAILGLVVVPLYLKYLGVEAYGLVGFYTSTSAMIQVLDMGLAPAMNREIARCHALGELEPGRALLHTLALCYWFVGVLIALALVAGAPWISHHWLRASSLDPKQLELSVALMGVVIGCRWPVGLYQNAIIGMQRLASASKLAATMATVSNLGAVFVLAFISRSITAFFVWQAFTALLYMLSMRALAWRIIARPVDNRFHVDRLKAVSHFSAGMTAVAVASVLVTQVDKLILSRMLTLADFGRYTLAWTLAGGLTLLITPFFNALYPRFCALVSQERARELWDLYSTSTAFLCAVLLPVAAAASIYGKQAVLVWTRNGQLSIAAGPVIGVVILGTAVNGIMHMPYALQLAYGMIRLPLYTAVTMALMVVPLILVLTPKWGTVGAASAWLILNLIYFVFGTLLTHAYLFKGFALQWVFKDVLRPGVITATVMIVALRMGTDRFASPLVVLVFAAFLTLLCICLNVLTSPELRAYIGANLQRRATA